MFKLFVGFLGGCFFGAIYVVNIPDGAIAKVAVILKVLISGIWG